MDLILAGRMRERPAEYGAVLTDTDDVALVWTDLDAGDRSAVTESNVRHSSILVQPNLITTSNHTTCPRSLMHTDTVFELPGGGGGGWGG